MINDLNYELSLTSSYFEALKIWMNINLIYTIIHIIYEYISTFTFFAELKFHITFYGNSQESRKTVIYSSTINLIMIYDYKLCVLCTSNRVSYFIIFYKNKIQYYSK